MNDFNLVFKEIVPRLKIFKLITENDECENFNNDLGKSKSKKNVNSL